LLNSTQRQSMMFFTKPYFGTARFLNIASKVFFASAVMVVLFFDQVLATEPRVPKQNAVGDWSIFVADTPRQCWVASKPAQRILAFGDESKKGNPDDGSVLIVALEKASIDGVEISYFNGYSFDIKYASWLEISYKKFEMLRFEEFAYLKYDAHALAVKKMMLFQEQLNGDLQIISEKVTEGGQIDRFTDTFHLAGFSRAFHKMTVACK
jgi:hypothetical protein